MIEKIQKISNPLTIIAIFAGLAEVASTVALAVVDKEVQLLLVWFVMLFPVFLASLFFVTLNFNPQVLYAPSDFQNEENFLNLLRNKKNLEVSFSRLNKELEGATDKILETIVSRFGQEAGEQRQNLRQLIELQFKELKTSVKETEESANVVSLQALTRSELQARIVAYLFSEKEPVPLSSISKAMGINETAVGRAVDKLVARDVITKSMTDDEIRHQLNVV